MSLYIANPHRQSFDFWYRLSANEPRDKGPAHVVIPPGGQTVIGKNWSDAEKAYVIKQLETHGARDAAEVHAKLKNFTGYLYRDMGQIEAEEIELGNEQVIEAQTERSAKEATRSALAFDRSVNKGARGRRAAKMTELEIKQEISPGMRPTGNEVDFSLAVDPDGRADSNIAI